MDINLLDENGLNPGGLEAQYKKQDDTYEDTEGCNGVHFPASSPDTAVKKCFVGKGYYRLSGVDHHQRKPAKP